MIRRPPRSTPKPSSAASDVYKRQLKNSADATKTLDIEGAAFTATSVTFTVPADAEAGN